MECLVRQTLHAGVRSFKLRVGEPATTTATSNLGVIGVQSPCPGHTVDKPIFLLHRAMLCSPKSLLSLGAFGCHVPIKLKLASTFPPLVSKLGHGS